MTTLRKNAMDLLEQMPEDKLYFIVQIMQGVKGLYGTEKQAAKDQAFEMLEGIRKKVPELDYDKELENYREEKYGISDISWYQCPPGLPAVPGTFRFGSQEDPACM